MITQSTRERGPGISDLYFRDASSTDLLDAEEEQELAQRIAEGDIEARDHFVRANLRFVVAIARKFLGRGVSLEDLIQEGNLGLVHAVERFDAARNFRFATFARYWIQQSIQSALDRAGPTIRLPSYALDLVSKWRQASKQLADKLGHAPTEDEVAKKLELAPSKLRTIKKALRIYNQQAGGSLNLLDEGHQQPSTTSPLEQSDEMMHVLKQIDHLEEREATILRMRFGLNGEEPKTFEQIGVILGGLTRERVRQIEKEALIKLRERIEESEG